MDNAGIIVAKIKTKIEQIITQNRALIKENKQLMATIEKLVNEKAERDKKIASLEAQIKVREFSAGLTDVKGSSKIAKNTVKKILREIDNCIALMNR